MNTIKEEALSKVNKRPKKVIVLSHMPMRDEMVDVAICAYLEMRGNLAWRKSLTQFAKENILSIQPDIVVIPEIRLEATRDMVKQLKEWGVTVVQKRCEMGITDINTISKDVEDCIFGRLEYTDYIDLDLCWGPKFRDMLIEHGSDPNKTYAVGAMGLDPYFNFRGESPKRPQKQVIFAGGFGYADMSADYAIPEAATGSDIHWKLVKADRENRCKFMELMGAFIERFKDWKVLFRPHPGENPQTYINAFGDKIIQATNKFAPMVLKEDCDLLIHTGSTMGLEAHLFGIPSLNFRNTSLDRLLGELAPKFDDIDSLLDAVEHTELGKSNADVGIVEELVQYFGEMDGRACYRAAELIDSLEVGYPKYPSAWPRSGWKYPSKGIYPNVYKWRCPFCMNDYYDINTQRNQSKCPYCGIMCIKTGDK